MPLETLLRLDNSSISSTSSNSGEQPQSDDEPCQPILATPALNQVVQDAVFQANCYEDLAQSPDDLLLDAARYNERFSLSLVTDIQLFLQHLFPIMPVVDGEEILSDAIRLDELSPSRYALVVSLCAATRIQLRMDNAKDGAGEGPDADIPLEPQLTGETLISLAENALRQFNVIEDTSLDSILSSFFLFSSYGNLNNSHHAWFYLTQSISLAQSLDLTRQGGYINLSESEGEKRRRVFWLLFVTERTFALQHRWPVMLRSCITKPQVIDSDYPAVMHDFVNHIHLFESLPCSLYEWYPESDNYQLKDSALAYKINKQLCTIQPDKSIIESQRFDTLITQQWLRVSIWRLVFGKKLSPAYTHRLLLPADLPIDAGRIIMATLDSIDPRSKDCHGIGMEQKLFDLGISLADSALLPGWSCSSFEIGPRDLLSAVVRALSKARGCQSHLLPTLLKHSEALLGFADPAAHIDIQWEVTPDAENLQQDNVIEEVSGQEDESIDLINWVSGDELRLSDLAPPTFALSCEDRALSCDQFDL
ncbi:hypothetical protein BFJ68_g17218 [Fusarium oxysporum]|uniref:Xylanolytic transcriptional activator regulatory domain-containing protein n=1 Tax=Fusarium oxysporum TaxID=5507 RepID=A0A420NIJ3_FUSOX|nr:hypothetical protein BFJ71_g16037 [Fusarium oxysporum]RKK85858.1 hypothetical protein BFJ68_g17218 [Fusarium oxysporum]